MTTRVIPVIVFNTSIPCTAWPQAAWSGMMGTHAIACRLETAVTEEEVPIAGLAGRCRIQHFGHRRILRVTLVRSGYGLICRRLPRRSTAVVLPSPSPPPLPKTCCDLVLLPVPFDLTHAPMKLEGTYRCPKETGALSDGGGAGMIALDATPPNDALIVP